MIHARNFARAGDPRAPRGADRSPRPDPRAAQRPSWKSRPATRTTGRPWPIPRVDAVVVVTPTSLHREVVLAAAKAGKHVLCEKPMAMDVRECDDMIDACARASVKLQIGFMRRYDESFRAAKERVDAGEIGEVVLVKSLTHGPSVPQEWMYDIAKSNGPLAEVNSHDIDAARWFTGCRDRRGLRRRRQLPLPPGAGEVPRFLRQRGDGLPVRRRPAGVHRRGGLRGLRLRRPHGDRRHARACCSWAARSRTRWSAARRSAAWCGRS